MRAWAAALAFHSSLGTSSPPMWMNFDGKIASTSSSTSCRNSRVRSSGLKISLKIPQGVATSDRLAGVAELGIGGDRGRGVPGHLDLRDDGDEPFGGVAHHLARLVLRVEAAVGFAPELPGLLPVGVRVPAAGPRALSFRQAPTSVSFGYFLISRRQPWSSVRCQ